MRMPILRPALLVISCLFVAGCTANPQAGSSLPGDANSGISSSVPPSLNAMRTLPAASPNYPTSLSPLDSSPMSVKALPVASARSSGSSSVAANSRKKQESVPNVSDGTLPGDSNVDRSGSNADAGSTFDNLELVDPGLKAKLAVLRVGSEPTANNLLSVFVGLRNKTSHPLDLEVQTIYKDNLDKTLNDGSWVPLTLKPRESTEYRSAAISSEATDFLVRVRPAVTTGAN